MHPAYICYIEAEEEDMEEDFQQCPLMMNIGIWRKSLIELYVFMNMPYHMDYAHTHVHMQTSSYYDTLDISDISEFEDIMTTSSDEYIPPLEDIGY